jgi:hypothetical protein
VNEVPIDDAGFYVFLAVLALNVAALFVDYLLMLWKQPTISEWVWKVPALGVPILVLQLVGLVGLGVHFYGIE